MIELTLTDTFSGELNYSWVKRHEITEPNAELTNRQILKIARDEFGITAKMRQLWDSDSEMVYKLDHFNIALHIMFNY